ncbi:hypothetical protein [Methanoregula sp.]|jgi:hypothetical protein|uniref:hypothetical protein n=1 Tax=Methanoregula sp. TaxID=2052170 RepID=UPI003C1B081C
MKPVHIIGILGLTMLLIFCAGCTSSQLAPPQSATATTVSTPPATIATPVPTITPYPGTLALNQPVTIGKADQTGTLTVYKVKILPNYSWTDPTFNSAHDQLKAGDSLFSTQYGYNTQNPAEGNVFLFVYARLTNTGTTSLGALSTGQFIVNYDGKDYAYHPISGSHFTFANGLGSPYNYDFENGGVTGFIVQGSANAADGFLIYEVPASFDIRKAAVVVTLDAENKTAWALA